MRRLVNKLWPASLSGPPGGNAGGISIVDQVSNLRPPRLSTLPESEKGVPGDNHPFGMKLLVPGNEPVVEYVLGSRS